MSDYADYLQKLVDALPPTPCRFCDEEITVRTARSHIRDKHPGFYAEMATKVDAVARRLAGIACEECGGTGWSNSHDDAFPCEACDGSGEKRQRGQ